MNIWVVRDLFKFCGFSTHKTQHEHKTQSINVMLVFYNYAKFCRINDGKCVYILLKILQTEKTNSEEGYLFANMSGANWNKKT